MTAPAVVKVEYMSRTYAEVGSQAVLETPALLNYAHILSADGNYVYYIDEDNNVNIADISDPEAPSDLGTIAALDGLVLNEADVGMVLDATGQYLYVANGNTSLYTLDLTDPEAPTLEDTFACITAASDNRHVLVRVDDTLYLLGDTQFQSIDITTPDAPAAGTTITATTTIGAGVYRGRLTPDEKYVMYPEGSTGSITGQIGLVDISSTPVEVTPIDLPDFDGSITTVPIIVMGTINFSSVDPDRMWFIGRYSDNGALSYFWMVYEKTTDWEDANLISDAIVGGLVEPTTYLTNEPYNSFSYGVIEDQIVVEQSRATGEKEDAVISFYALEAEEILPQLVIKEGGRTSKAIEGVRYFSNILLADGVVVGVGVGYHTDGSAGIFGALAVYVPTEVVVTDVGWVDISSDVDLSGSRIQVGGQGISGFGFADRMAGTGKMSLRLQNYDPVGLYSPENANLRTNFGVGAPIRLQLSGVSASPLKTKFLGRIESIDPDIKRENKMFADIVCVDAMDVLSKAKAKGLSVRTSITAKRIVELALDLATGVPIVSTMTNALDETSDIYAFAFDGIEDDEVELSSEIQKALESERGWLYYAYQNALTGADGGFRFESRSTRNSSPVFALPADGAMLELIQTEHSARFIKNRVQGRVFPRSLDSAPETVLFTLQSKPKLKFGESITLTAPYTDPSEKASRVSATEMQPPIGGTDYKFTAKKNGGGTNLTSNLAVRIEFGGSSAEVTLTNNGSPAGYVSLFRLIGRGLYSYDPLTVTKRDLVSIVEHGLSDEVFELPHQDELTVASDIADKVLTAYKAPRTFIVSAKLAVSKSEDNLNAFLNGEIGDKYFIEDDILGVDKGTSSPFIVETSELGGLDSIADEAAVYVIHNIEFAIGEGNDVHATWGLFPASVRL